MCAKVRVQRLQEAARGSCAGRSDMDELVEADDWAGGSFLDVSIPVQMAISENLIP